MNTALLALTVVLFAVVVARFVHERGMQALDADQKTRYLASFAWQRRYGLLPLIALILVALAFPQWMSLPLFVALAVAYVLAIVGYSVRRMRQIQLPERYVRAYVAGQAVQLAGLVAYFAVIHAAAP